jgi:hypothetical protein
LRKTFAVPRALALIATATVLLAACADALTPPRNAGCSGDGLTADDALTFGSMNLSGPPNPNLAYGFADLPARPSIDPAERNPDRWHKQGAS